MKDNFICVYSTNIIRHFLCAQDNFAEDTKLKNSALPSKSSSSNGVTNTMEGYLLFCSIKLEAEEFSLLSVQKKKLMSPIACASIFLGP